jgi:hypothetical protein
LEVRQIFLRTPSGFSLEVAAGTMAPGNPADAPIPLSVAGRLRSSASRLAGGMNLGFAGH